MSVIIEKIINRIFKLILRVCTRFFPKAVSCNFLLHSMGDQDAKGEWLILP